jgi:hypothetical protein
MTNKQKFDAAKRHLRTIRGVAQARKQWHYSGPPKAYNAGGQPIYGAHLDNVQRANTYTGQYGIEPNDEEVVKFMRSMGGYGASSSPRLRPAAPAVAQAGPSATGGAAPFDLMGMAQGLAQDAKSQQDARNRSDDERFRAIIQGRKDAYGRIMGDISNQGQLDEALMRERNTDNTENVKAYLSAHGLANSNILPSFMMRGNRDLELQLLGQRESQSRQRAQMDSKLSDDLFNFVERKTATGPDMSQVYGTISQLAQADALNKARMEQAKAQAARPTAPRYNGGGGGGGVSSMMAQQMAANMGANFNPVGMMQARYGGFGGGGQYNAAAYSASRDARAARGAANKSLVSAAISGDSDAYAQLSPSQRRHVDEKRGFGLRVAKRRGQQKSMQSSPAPPFNPSGRYFGLV